MAEIQRSKNQKEARKKKKKQKFGEKCPKHHFRYVVPTSNVASHKRR